MAGEKITLVGFMGTGKTTVGKLIADRLGWRFVDTDALIEKRTGKTIPEIFAEDGEETFRTLETTLCTELVTWKHTVISTGGGILLRPENRVLIRKNGLTVCLTATPEQIAERLAQDTHRPLIATEDPQERMVRLKTLFESRAALYGQIPYQFDTTHSTPFIISEKIIALWRSQR
jgi:shikimate kinase